jgi:hypothetical protein
VILDRKLVREGKLREKREKSMKRFASQRNRGKEKEKRREKEGKRKEKMVQLQWSSKSSVIAANTFLIIILFLLYSVDCRVTF